MMKFDHLVKKKVIDRRRRGLRDGDLDVLVELLQKSKVLAELDLVGNQITLSDGKFTNALASNHTLRKLHLNFNKIGPEGAKKLADALKINKTLQELNISFNQIGDEGSKSIADAFMSNSSLQVLDLRHNNIGNEGAQSLAGSLLVNQSLDGIWLDGNNISDKGAEKLADALRFNCTIEELDLEGNDDVSKKVLDKIEGIVKDSKRESQNLTRSGLDQLMDFVALKDEQIAKNHAEIKAKDQEIASLKATNLSPLKQLEKYIASKDEKIASLEATVSNSKPINHTVGLTSEEAEHTSKRQRTGNAVKSYLPKLIQVKQEKHDVETALKSTRDEKEAAEANLEEAKDDLGDANELVEQQALATDIWQRRFDELASLVAGQVDCAALSAIRHRSLASGS